MPCSQALSTSSFTANDQFFCWENFLRVFSRIAYCFSVAGVVREERSKAEKEYFHQLVDAGMCLHICHVTVKYISEIENGGW